MGTSATPSAVIKQAPVQKSLLNLDTFEDVTLRKTVPDFHPVASMHDAAARVGNDQAKLVQAINEGLRIMEREAVMNNPNIPWQVVNDEDEMEGEFTGIPADPKKVNTLILSLAKTVFGFTKDLDKEAKAAAKESAKNLIRTTPSILEPLKKTAALTEE